MTSTPHRRSTRWLLGILCGALALALAAPAPLAQDRDEPPEPGDETDGDQTDGDEEATPLESSDVGIPADELLRLYDRKYGWEELQGGVTQTDMTAAAISPRDNRVMYVGGGGQVYRSRDGGDDFDNTLSVQGLNEAIELESRQGGDQRRQVDLSARRQELIDERVQQRFLELRQQTLDELEGDVGDRDFAEDLVEEVEDELREQARTEVLTEDLDEIEAQIRADAGLSGQGGGGGDDPDVEDDDPDDIAANAIQRVTAHPTRPFEAWAASGAGLYRTTDAGTSWELVFRGLGGDSRFTTSVANLEDVTIVGTLEGLYRSSNASRWERFPGRLGSLPILDVAMATPGTLVVLTGEGVFRSDDAGATWTRHVLPTELETVRLSAIDVSGYNPDRVVMGTERGVYLSTNGGKTFSLAGRVGLASLDINDVLFHPASPDVMLAATDRGVYITIDSVGWQPLPDGLAAAEIRRLAIGHTAPFHVVAATAAGAFLLRPGGKAVAHDKAMKRLREAWDKEPTVGSVIAAALRFNHLTQSSLDSISTRARFQAFLPSIRGQVEFEQHRLEGDTLYVDLPDYSIRRNRSLRLRPQGLSWEVFAMWDLNRMIFTDTELRANATVQTLQRNRRRMLALIVKLYGQRRILMHRVALRASSTNQRNVKDALRIKQMTAQIDALTDSFFSRTIELRR